MQILQNQLILAVSLAKLEICYFLEWHYRCSSTLNTIKSVSFDFSAAVFLLFSRFKYIFFNLILCGETVHQ